jgi:ribosome-associated heat shock protein Hsp15
MPRAASRRLDQWLWFTRLAKTRSLAARLCTAGAISANGAMVRKPNHPVRIGDTIVAPQGAFQRSVRVRALGSRRGPPNEAQLLYEEAAAPVRLSTLAPAWAPLLAETDLES